MVFVVFLCFLIVTTTAGQQCQIGFLNYSQVYEMTEATVIKGSWYLNLNYPSPCSGILRWYDIIHYQFEFQTGKLYRVYVTVWKRSEGSATAYTIDSDEYTVMFEFMLSADKRKRADTIHTFTFYDDDFNKFIGKGSYIGVFFESDEETVPMPVIGNSSTINSTDNNTVCIKSSSSLNEVEIDCSPSYLVSNQTINARAGVYSINCDEPPIAVANASIKYVFDDDSEYGSISAQYQCNPGYEMVGNGDGLVACSSETGSWIGNIPTCQIVSCESITIPNGKINITSLTYGSIAEFSCNSGYALIGHSSAKCIGINFWSHETPFCVLPCPVFNTSLPLHVIGLVRETYFAGDVLYFSCSTGYNLIGDSALSCSLDGTWKGIEPSCTNQTSSSSTPSPSNITNSTNQFLVPSGTIGSIAGVIAFIVLLIFLALVAFSLLKKSVADAGNRRRDNQDQSTEPIDSIKVETFRDGFYVWDHVPDVSINESIVNEFATTNALNDYVPEVLVNESEVDAQSTEHDHALETLIQELIDGQSIKPQSDHVPEALIQESEIVADHECDHDPETLHESKIDAHNIECDQVPTNKPLIQDLQRPRSEYEDVPETVVYDHPESKIYFQSINSELSANDSTSAIEMNTTYDINIEAHEEQDGASKGIELIGHNITYRPPLNNHLSAGCFKSVNETSSDGGYQIHDHHAYEAQNDEKRDHVYAEVDPEVIRKKSETRENIYPQKDGQIIINHAGLANQLL